MISFMIGFLLALFLIVWMVVGAALGLLYLAKTAPQQLGELSERVIWDLKKDTTTK